MTEEQRYTVVRQFDGCELRRYEPHVRAEVSVRGDFESAGSRGFRPLVSYIGGSNADGQKVAMTAPVIQESAGSEHAVAFVMPAGSAVTAMPAPTDPGVRMRAVDEEYVAALRFSGRWNESACAENAEQLLAKVRAAGLEPIGSPRFARYDPPWTLWFLRRNEVLVPVAFSATAEQDAS